MTDQRHPTPPYRTALTEAGADPLQPADPARIGPYVPLGRLGSGGMGRVYLARPADTGAPGLAAVKVIRPEYAEDPEFRRRFEREAAVHGRVSTPHAPRLLGTGFEHELLWMATEYVPGVNLADAVRQGGRLEPAGVWRLVAELGQALAALATAGVVHRDLKPSNVLLSTQGVHVIDFGISRAVDSSAITGTGSRVGTPAFMSPEYLREGRSDGASDVFSLAGTLIYAATGHAPFGDGTGVDVMHRVAFEEPRAEVMSELAAADPALADLLTACLSKDPTARPTPDRLTEAAATAHEHVPPTWHEALSFRLLARQDASTLLAQAVPPETVRLRAPVEGGVGAAGAGGAFGAVGAVGGAGAARSADAGQGGGFGQVGAYPTPSTPPGQFGTAATTPRPYSPGEHPAPRTRKKPYLVLAAGAAVVAVAAGAFFLTRPSHSEAASASPGVSSSAASSDAGKPASVSPGTSPEPSASESEAKADGKAKAKATDGATGGAEGDEGGAGGRTPSATATRGGGGGGGTSTTPAPAPTATVTETASAPATPAWISDCTYYSGTELTTYGDKGQRVVQVQCMLTKRGYSVGDAGVDGQFGKDTLAAVKQFQTAKGLEVDGEVGPKTWAALRSSS
ncbi:serine/threonine-protein kinase [Streptomyces sp. NPDC046909]|uniref:serine/threonine-protein kinase n=1 Tax=Streptomyces sp. NPDC046909 TaxID=3155617 RepID=UPI0033C5A0C4